jgi:hypothetical protein
LSRSSIPFYLGAFFIIAAEGGDFHHFASHAHMHYLKAATNDARTAEQASDLFRFGAGGHIEILGFTAEQEIAHTTAYQISLVT